MLDVRKIVLASSVCFTGMTGNVSLAQENGGIILDTITVTASKREQALNSIDASVSVVTAAQLEERGIRTVDDLQKVFPGLSIANRGNRIYSNFTIRGLSSPDYFNPTVQIYVDGAPQTPSTFSQMLVDVDRVELLRGPQGTLYGANAYGGVINIITKKGDKNRFYIQSTISAQEPSVQIGGTAVLTPDTLFLDYAGTFAHFSGDFDDRTTGDDNINTSDNGFGRATLRYAPTGGDFDASITYSREWLRSHEEVYAFQQDVDDRIYDSGLYGELPLLKRKVTNISGQFNYRFGDFTLSSISAYQESDVMRNFSSGAGSRYFWPQNDKLFTQEMRLAYDSAMFSGVAGLWYSHDDFTGTKNGYTGYYGDSSNNVVNDSIAAFGEVTWHATDKLDLTGGLRATYDRSSIDAYRDDTYATGYGFDFDNKAHFTSIQPKVAIGYEIAPDTRLFGVISRGYKPGGFNHSISSTIDASPYEAESAWNFETGVKSTLLGGAVDVSASVYYIRSTDKQIYVGMIGQQFIRNAGEATSAGIELEGTWRATNRLTLTGNAAFGRSEFTDFTDPYTGVSYDGNHVPYAPDVTTHINIAYILSEDILNGTLTANGGVNYNSKVYFDEANSTGQDGFSTFDASLDFANTSGFKAQLYVQNIADKSYKTSGFVNGPYELGTLGKGRTFGLTLRKDF
ncbi:TonB-dependent receptor [Brucella pseudogrignonensis]|uniref:Heme transporter BhuA n=1 Tax=Brucella pseudogrignonensis TaxID=419475 RepID=A0ABU1MBR0_9HYPH|nr:TonB-dependent receptor [Brucella pseudogrignonensis]MDR6433487.1 pesticin/yersiniabactin receptor [Brucella pseudogrignonensis]